jgi:hypothetical protein
MATARAQRATLPTTQFDKLIAGKSPIFVRNNMAGSKALAGRAAGDLLIGLVDPDTKKSYTLAIPKNSTVCVTDQVSHATLANSNEFRRYLSNSLLLIYDEDGFEKIEQEDPDHIEYSQDQLERVTATMSGEEQNPMFDDGTTGAAIAESAKDMLVRPQVAAFIMDMQSEGKSQTTLTQELKGLGDLSAAEKTHLKDNMAKVPADRAKLRAALNKL